MRQHDAQTKIIVRNELRSLFRNKRLLGLGIFGIFFYICYSFLLLDTNLTETNVILFLLVLAALPGSTIGFATFAKDGNCYDGLMSLPISVDSYVRSKLFFAGMFTLVHYLVPLSYLLLNVPKYFFLLLGVLLYTLFIGLPLMVYLFSFNPQKIDITGRIFLNYEGVSYWKPFVLMPPMGLLLFDEKTYILGIVLMYIAGGGGFLLFNRWVALIGNRVRRQKYKWARCYRS